MAEYTITATVKLNGVIMVVEAGGEAEARRMAEQEPDYDLQYGELVDWTISHIEKTSD